MPLRREPNPTNQVSDEDVHVVVFMDPDLWIEIDCDIRVSQGFKALASVNHVFGRLDGMCLPRKRFRLGFNVRLGGVTVCENQKYRPTVIDTSRPVNGVIVRQVPNRHSVDDNQYWVIGVECGIQKFFSRRFVFIHRTIPRIETMEIKNRAATMSINVSISFVDGSLSDWEEPVSFYQRVATLRSKGFEGKSLIEELFGDDWAAPPRGVRLSGTFEDGTAVEESIPYR